MNRDINSIEIELSFKQYSLLERSIRGDISLSHRLCSNHPISKNELIMELLEEIRDFEYDEGDETPLEFRLYEDGRNLLQTISEKIYPNEGDRYIKYLTKKKLVDLNSLEQDTMVTIKIV